MFKPMQIPKGTGLPETLLRIHSAFADVLGEEPGMGSLMGISSLMGMSSLMRMSSLMDEQPY